MKVTEKMVAKTMSLSRSDWEFKPSKLYAY